MRKRIFELTRWLLREVVMSGLVFALFMFVILIVVGALFSWMVYLADTSKLSNKLTETKPLCGYKCPV